MHLGLKKQVCMIRKKHNNTQQTNTRRREKEPKSNNSHKTSGTQKSNQLSPRHQAKLERTHSYTQQNMEQTQNPTIGATMNNKSTTT